MLRTIASDGKSDEGCTVVVVDAQLVVEAIAGSREWGISSWDALIIRAAQAADCRRVLSEDLGDGGRYGPVRIENPFG